MQDYSSSFYSFSHSNVVVDIINSAPDDKSIGIRYYQKISEKVSPIPISILHMKSIANTCSKKTSSVYNCIFLLSSID